MDDFYQKTLDNMTSDNINYNLLKEEIRKYLRETSGTNLSKLRRELIIEKAKHLSQIEYQQLILTINKKSNEIYRGDNKKQLIKLSESLLQSTIYINNRYLHNNDRYRKRQIFSSSIKILDTNWKYKLIKYNERTIGENIHIYDLVFKDSKVSLQKGIFKMSFISQNIHKSLNVEYFGGNKLYYIYQGQKYEYNIEKHLKQHDKNIKVYKLHIELYIKIPNSKILLTVNIPIKRSYM